MIRVLFLFAVLFVVFWAVIQGSRHLTGKQALGLTKTAGLSIICACLALMAMFGLVVLF